MSKDTTKRGSWSLLESFWESFNSIIAVPVPLLDLKPWRTLFICRMAQRRVWISASTIFHIVSNRTMPCVSAVPFGIRTRTAHPSSWEIYPMCHMCCNISTRNSQRSLRRGIFNCSPG